MSEKSLSKADSARDAVRSAARSLASSQGGDTTVTDGTMKEGVGGEYAGGDCQDHDREQMHGIMIW